MSDPARTVDVILRDGRTLRLRPPRSEDREALVDFLTRLSAESLRLRFLHELHPAPALIDPYLNPDWLDRGALIGSFGDAGGERVVSLASYERLRDPQVAEAAFAVADALHGLGIATRMLEQLAARAAAAGIERLVFEIMPANAAMRRVVAEVGLEVVREISDGVVEATMSIEPTGARRAAWLRRPQGSVPAITHDRAAARDVIATALAGADDV